MFVRAVLFFASLVLTSCIFSPEFPTDHGPLESGIYESRESPRLVVCKDASGARCDSLLVKTYWDVGTKWIKFRSYAGNTLVCRGDARLGEVSGDTLMLSGFEAKIFVPASWESRHVDSLPFILVQQASRGFRVRLPLDTAWMEFRKRR